MITVDLQPLKSTILMHDEQNIAVVCNPLAGAGTAMVFAQNICTKLTAGSISYKLFSDDWPADFTGFTHVFIVGGDGTLNFFVNRYPNIKLPLVIFNAGTGNDFHWLLYGKQNLDEQMELIFTTSPKPIDLGRCNEQYFINGAGIGFEGNVAKALTGKKKRPGKRSFLLAILKKIFFYRSASYSIKTAEWCTSGKKLLIDIANGRRAGGGFHIAPESNPDDGLFDLVVANALNGLQRLRYLPVIENGKHLDLGFIHHHRTTKIEIKSDSVIQYHLDGEYAEAKNLEIEILPAHLLFLY